MAGSRSFAAIGQWAANAGPEVLAVLGAARGPAEESTFRRAFALVSADVLDRVLGAWLWTRAVQASGRLVIAVDGKTVRGAKDKDGKAPHLVAALAHGIGAVLGQVAVDAKPDEIPAVRDLLKAFASLASAVVTIDAMHTQHDTAQVILGRGADYVMTVKGNMPALYRQLKKLPWARIPAVSSVSTDHGRRARRTIKVALAPAWIGFDGAACCPALKMPMSGALGVPMAGMRKPRRCCCGGAFVGEVPVVVGKVPVVSVDDLGDGGAGGGFVDEVLAGGEGGDQGLQGEVVDRAGVAAAGGVDQVQASSVKSWSARPARLRWWVT